MKKLLAGFLILWAGVCWAGQKEGKHYELVPFEVTENEMIQDLKADHTNQMIVLEFFSYGCHWCHRLDPKVEAWKASMPENVVFLRVPVVFQGSWANLAKAYYTSKALNVDDVIHPALFDAIANETITSSAPDVLQVFFKEHGVEPIDFAKAFDSFGVEQEFKRFNQLAIAYKITAIPTFIIQGPDRAYLTSTRMAGGEDEVLSLVTMLVDKELEQLSPVENSN